MTRTESPSADRPSSSAFLPVLLVTGVLSVVSSMFVSNYWGMGLALLTLVLAASGLESSRGRTWVIGLATAGFALGLMALLMKVFVMNARG